MKRRWIILASVGLSVVVLDQWSKYLAIEHLTPAFALSHAGRPHLTASEIEAIEAELGFTQKLSYFYGGVEHPCRPLDPRCPTVEVIDGFWNWRYVENPGAAWGLLAGADEKVRVPFFLIISVAAVVFIINFFRKLEENQLLLIVSLSLVFGGAIGNFIDRLHLSYVIDFIDWYVGTAHWPTFNVADAAISTGVGLMALEWIKDTLAKRARSSAPEESSA